MSERAPLEGRRSGCSLVMGVFLIILGALLLAQNFVDLQDLLDVSLFTLLHRSLALFADYWPLLLVVWGAFKIFQRFVTPERARVSGFEIVLFLLVVGAGLSLRVARLVVEEVAGDVSMEEVFGIAGMEILGGPAHRFEEERELDLGSSRVLLVVNPGGSIKISGWDEPNTHVVLTKRIRHLTESDARRLASGVGLELEVEPSTDRARLSVVLPGERGRIETDLVVRVPRGFDVAVENRRGRVEVFDVDGKVDIETAHDRIDASNLGGALRAGTRYGDIRVDAVSGNVELSSHDGAITARGLSGDLRAETSHGRVAVEDVAGRAVIESRYGDVRATGIGGALDVISQNGDVSVESAGGAVRVEASHRTVFVRDVQSGLSIDARNATVQAREIRGDVEVLDSNGSVTIVSVGGAVSVRARETRVVVERVEGAIDVETSQEEVRVARFGSSLAARSTHAEVSAETEELMGNVSLQTTYGDASIALPADARFRFVGTARDGELRTEWEELELQADSEGGRRRWVASRGGEAAPHVIELDTSYGDLLLLRISP